MFSRLRARTKTPERLREELVSMFSKPRLSPVEYWKRVAAQAPVGSLAEKAAAEALAKLRAVPDRVPGEDDE